MNRHERRAAWAQGIIQASQDADGVMELVIVRPVDLRAMYCSVLLGGRAAHIASLVTRTLLSVYENETSNPVLCLSCGRPIGRKGSFSVVLAIPDRVDPSNAVTSVMCTCCAREPGEIRKKAIEAFRSIWPDARAIEISGQAGRA